MTICKTRGIVKFRAFLHFFTLGFANLIEFYNFASNEAATAFEYT